MTNPRDKYRPYDELEPEEQGHLDALSALGDKAVEGVTTVGDEKALDVPDGTRFFQLPPGEYTVMAACVCSKMIDFVVTEPADFRGVHLAFVRRIFGEESEYAHDEENCRVKRWSGCRGARGGRSRVRAFVPRQTRYERGTRKLDWGHRKPQEGGTTNG